MNKNQRSVLGLGVLAATISVATAAQAVDFDIGQVQGRLDSQLSIGASWGTSKPSSRLIDANNGGRGASSTGDDGRMNFQRGETFSKIFKGVHDLEFQYGESGAFFRGKYWYDFELKDESRPFKQISDKGRAPAAKSAGYDLLDAFVYHNYRLGERPGHLRLGQQVVSWGESTFIGGGINAVNPWDVAALRRPGAELKEGLLPVQMIFASQRLTDALNLEAFYQLKWEPYVLDNCGTFFGSDVAAPGCTDNFTVLDGDLTALSPIAALHGQGYRGSAEGVIIPRLKDRKARDDGQWGLALRWQSDSAEFGFFAMNYHSRIPFLAYQAAAPGTYAELNNILGSAMGMGVTDPAALEGLAAATVLGNARYFMDYPEDIRLFGASFATTLPTGTAWSGEISYRPNAPVGFNATDMTLGLLTPVDPGMSNLEVEPGGQIRGYKRKKVSQVQSTLIHTVDQILGAEQLVLVGEAALTHVSGLESTRQFRYGRDTVFGDSRRKGYTTGNAWGYRLAASLEYSDVFAGINLEPNLAWSHDVSGYGPNDSFIEGAKAISLGLDANYLNKYSASLSYTNFFGGRYNTQSDRDFVSFSIGVSF